MNKFKTREEWLEAAVKLMTPRFKSVGFKVPDIHVSVGWPSIRGMSAKAPRIGECWDKSSSDDKISHIFISPRLDDVTGEQGVLSVLVHEVDHAVVGNECGHKGAFRKCALAVGLEGKMTSTHAGKDLMGAIKDWSKTLGGFPHAKLNPEMKPAKKQSTRMIKCECKDCGYIARTTNKWIEEKGAPICPCNKTAMRYEVGDEDTDTDGEDE
jgi:hypothetical protein